MSLLARLALIGLLGGRVLAGDPTIAPDEERLGALLAGARTELQDGRPSEAQVMVEAAERMAPGDARVELAWGLVLEGLHLDNQSRERYRRALAANPCLHEAALHLGDLALRAGDIPDSSAAYNIPLSANCNLPADVRSALEERHRRSLQEDAEFADSEDIAAFLAGQGIRKKGLRTIAAVSNDVLALNLPAIRFAKGSADLLPSADAQTQDAR